VARMELAAPFLFLAGLAVAKFAVYLLVAGLTAAIGWLRGR